VCPRSSDVAGLHAVADVRTGHRQGHNGLPKQRLRSDRPFCACAQNGRSRIKSHTSAYFFPLAALLFLGFLTFLR
jgi:hypothetical protein